jgi:hypothetical protein
LRRRPGVTEKNSIFNLDPPHAKKCGYLEGIIPAEIGGNYIFIKQLQKLYEFQTPSFLSIDPIFFPNPKFQPTGNLTLKFQIPFRIADKNGFAVPVSIHQSDIPAVKINPELPSKSLLSQFPLIKKNQALAIQLPPQMLTEDVPYGKIIETSLSTQSLKMIQIQFVEYVRNNAFI